MMGLVALLLVVLGGLSLYAFNQFEKPVIGVDDANITFVYARHLAQGHGFVYNIGGERVEGFTTLLWVLISGAFFSITQRPELPLLALNILLMIATNLIAIFYLYQTQNLRKDITILVAYLLFVVVIPDYIVWMTLPLMETGLWSFLLTGTAITVLLVDENSGTKYALLLSVLIGLLLLTRPEAIAWGLLFILLTGLQMVTMVNIRKGLKLIAIPTITYFAILGALTIFRLSYFGYPLPNTYYAKVSPSILFNLKVGFEYFLSYLNSGFIIGIVIFSTLIFFSKDLYALISLNRQKTGQPDDARVTLKNFSLGMICLTGLLLPILPGGDHFKSFRFYQPIYPLLVVYLLASWFSLIKGRSYARWITLAALVTMVFFVNYTHEVTWNNVGEKGVSILVEFRIAKQGRERGIFLANIFDGLEEYPTLGTIASGGIKMTYPGEVIDLMGLNNLQMGHSSGLREGTKNHAAFNKEVFFQQRPQIIGSNCNPLNALYLPGLSEDPEFQNLYQCATVKRIGEKGKYQGFFRNDFLLQLSEDVRFRVETQPEQ
jgi:hypothetical protein